MSTFFRKNYLYKKPPGWEVFYYGMLTQRLYSYIKAVFAAGTNYGVLTLLLWKAQIVLAGRALSVNVSLSVADLAFLKVDMHFRLFNKL